MSDCIFCKIVSKQSPATILLQTDQVTVFKDIYPQAKIHYVVVPNLHLSSVNDLEPEHNSLISELILTAKQAAHELNIAESGYRLVINTGPDANQTVPHLHIHILGGESLTPQGQMEL